MRIIGQTPREVFLFNIPMPQAPDVGELLEVKPTLLEDKTASGFYTVLRRAWHVDAFGETYCTLTLEPH